MLGPILLMLQTILPPNGIVASVFPQEPAPITWIDWAETPDDSDLMRNLPRKAGSATVSLRCKGIGRNGRLTGCRIAARGDPDFDALAMRSLRHFRTSPSFAREWHHRAEDVVLELNFVVPGSDKRWTGCRPPFCILHVMPPPPPPPPPRER